MAFYIGAIKIPKRAGCYIFMDSNNHVLYIGKAKNLFNRVRSYFNSSLKGARILEMVGKVGNVEFIVTSNEVEALLLEARLIKQHQPPYNIMLKDNVPYMYIKITDEEYPRLISSRTITNDGAKYFGPFVYGKGRKILLLTTARLFGIRTEKFISKSSKELYKLLSAIKEQEFDKISKTAYKQNVKMAEMFLRGKRDKLIDYLSEKMKKAAQRQNYELAKLCKDQLDAIVRFSDKQLMSIPKSYDQDIINFVARQDKITVQLFNVNKGVVSSRSEHIITNNNKNTDAVLYFFIQQYYLTKPIPKEIIIPQHLDNQELLQKYLNKLNNKKVVITVPKIGDKKKLLEIVRQNILVKINDEAEKELLTALNLPTLPLKIDGFDISNISGVFAVGSCVRFSSGNTDKSMYRRFKIKTVRGANDFAMMYEVLNRRYRHNEWDKPDLILIDGGKGQLLFAKKALNKLKLDIPVISIAKREEEVFQIGKTNPYLFDKKSKGLKLLQKIRDESHRFAINYHKKLRTKQYGK